MTDTPNMRERLARKLDAAVDAWIKANGGDKGMADMPPELLVDAILAELERPSKAMVKAGNAPRGYTMDGYPQQYTSTDVWAAMVKAIRGGA